LCDHVTLSVLIAAGCYKGVAWQLSKDLGAGIEEIRLPKNRSHQPTPNDV